MNTYRLTILAVLTVLAVLLFVWVAETLAAVTAGLGA